VDRIVDPAEFVVLTTLRLGAAEEGDTAETEVDD
jgi:hypothetical protein